VSARTEVASSARENLAGIKEVMDDLAHEFGMLAGYADDHALVRASATLRHMQRELEYVTHHGDQMIGAVLAAETGEKDG
jgi:hypothetical protein